MKTQELFSLEKSDPHPQERAVKQRPRLPLWLHYSLPQGDELSFTEGVLRAEGLHTVCEEAKCPNRPQCYSDKTATFLALGSSCTRACGFCDIDHEKNPPPIDPLEGEKIARAVHSLGLRHVVITMVARDDLPDGGARAMADIVAVLRREVPQSTIELLTSDFGGEMTAWELVAQLPIEIFNHNVETVRSRTKSVRHKATFDRSLELLRFMKQYGNFRWVKSGMMVGLGESQEEVFATLKELSEVVDIVTIGQYLEPKMKGKLRLREYIHPDVFRTYEEFGRELGLEVFAAPFVRSSLNAGKILEQLTPKV